MKKDYSVVIFALIATSLFILANDVFALTAPTTGSFAYDVHDILVTKMLKGPIGFAAGVAAVVFGAVQAIQAKILPAIPAIIGGALLLKADAVVTTLGAII